MDKEKIVIASDHAGFSHKEKLKTYLMKEGFEVLDEGTHSSESCDYPDTVSKAAARVSSGEIKRGIVLCGSGVGASIVANKYPNVRAALAWSPSIAKLVKEHNDANILVLPGRYMSAGKAKSSVKEWLKTPFSQGANHVRRISKIALLEKGLKLSLLLLLFIIPSQLSAKNMEWTGPQLSTLIREDVQYSKQENRISLKIDYDLPSTDDETELLLEFNSPCPVEESTGKYKTKTCDLFKNRSMLFRNSGTGGFVLPANKLVLATKPKDYLNNRTDLESFTISFWVYPTINASGMRTIFEKGNNKDGKFFGLKIFLSDRRIHFRFSNMFFDIQGNAITLETETSETVELEKWTHCSLSFDNTTGKMTLSRDNEEDQTLWATVSRQPEGEILTPKFSGLSDIRLGGQPFGYLDDFLITRKPTEQPEFAKVFREERGHVMTDVIQNDFYNSRIETILINNLISERGFKVQIRTSQEQFDPSAQKPDWKDFVGPVEAKFFQVRLQLQTDHKMRTSPELKSLIIKTADMNDIEPPSLITLTVAGEDLLVEWNRLFDKRLRGYNVHVRDLKGQQWKIDARNSAAYTVKGLKDNETYLISVSSYDDAVPANESKPSREKQIHFKYRSSGNE